MLIEAKSRRPWTGRWEHFKKVSTVSYIPFHLGAQRWRSVRLFPMLNALVAVRKGVHAVKFCSKKLGVSADAGCTVLLPWTAAAVVVVVTPSICSLSASIHAISQSMSYLWFISVMTCSLPIIAKSMSFSNLTTQSEPDHQWHRNVNSSYSISHNDKHWLSEPRFMYHMRLIFSGTHFSTNHLA